MTDLEFYKYICEKGFEYHWLDDETDVILFVPLYELDNFKDMLGSNIFEEPIKCYMKYDYIVFHMQDICDFWNIDISDIFDKD